MAAFKYEYRLPGLVKASAQEVGELFERLEKRDGMVTPAAVLEESRAEGSLLHDEFEWNDGKAAEKYRLGQARFLINHLQTVIVKTNDREEMEKQKERAFVVAPGWKGAYVALDRALKKAEWRDFLLKSARQDMETFIAKYRRLEELASVIKAMEKAKDKQAVK